MMQLVSHLELITELIQSFHVKRPIELNGYINIGQQVMCQPYITETAVPQLFQQFVMLRYDMTFL